MLQYTHESVKKEKPIHRLQQTHTSIIRVVEIYMYIYTNESGKCRHQKSLVQGHTFEESFCDSYWSACTSSMSSPKMVPASAVSWREINKRDWR